MTVKAYAKVNFILNVLGTLPNGYHEVEMFMQAIDLHDDVAVSIRPADDFRITLRSGREDLPCGPGNLAWKAASLMHDEFRPGRKEEIVIEIVKRIPVAAGLAGGSADAAAVVHGLAAEWGVLDQKEKLHAICAAMGSDIPFSLAAQTGCPAAIARGTGTDLEAVRPVDCTLVICTPAVEVPTPVVYKALKDGDCTKRADLQAFINAGSIEEKVKYMGNHLQYPAVRMFPQIREALDLLAEPASDAHSGAGLPLAVQQSGSGPTVFAVYPAGASPKAPDMGSSFVVRTLL